MGMWKDIQSAPADGTTFIGFDGSKAYVTRLGKHYVLFPYQEGGPTFKDAWHGEDHDAIFSWYPTLWTEIPGGGK